NFMRVFEMSKSRNFRDLSLPISGLYLLAAPSTPEEVQQQVIGRAEAGERFSHAQIKEVIADAKAASKPRNSKSRKSKMPHQGQPEQTDLEDAITAAGSDDVQASADARKAEAASEEHPDGRPGGGPAKAAMSALCWLILAASPDAGDPQLAE